MQGRKLIWILEDDMDAQFVYSETFSEIYNVKFFSNISDFKIHLDVLQKSTDKTSLLPGLMIADLRLPDGSFFQLLQDDQIRSAMTFPILVISSIDDVETLQTSFDHGVIDYLTKPFNTRELVVKVERWLKKHSIPQALKSLGLETQPNNFRIVQKDGKFVQLTPKEFHIFNLFLENVNFSCCKNDIIEKIWGGTLVGHKTLDVHLSNLRKKIEPISLDISYLPPEFYQVTSLRR
jgi:two-component system alkaline phosphatase synthesis response regulator PhoP